jgi:tetratricopeptide (TPR) repeat protein/tRNA A-37 threonylcarbamoyl transferase component Bud32
MKTSPKEELLFHAAAPLPADERAPFLDRECTGQPQLRARLEALLAAHDQPKTLNSPETGKHGSTVSQPPCDDPVGQCIGRYTLLERLGEGGCGIVFVAEQTEPVRRRVALKLIQPGMDTKAVIARFAAERQALALIDHPNIAKVLDAGTTDSGRPFFVMELVRGLRITTYCDQEKLSTHRRLELFIKVCQAIQHAHQKGIIHRDIKPSNILVTLHDGVPVPKVIDFGIAKATEGRLTDVTLNTQVHQLLGTPAYMSPEQAEMSGLDIDTRTDIYSLGVVLYEMLTGVTPFEAKELMAQGVDGMRRAIREKEPLRPSIRLTQRQGVRTGSPFVGRPLPLSSDLDWIVMKCLEKDRGRRYETANGLAADLKRHLNNEPVVARPPSAAYRFRKAFRRNRMAFVAGAAIAATLVLASLTSLWQATRAKLAELDALEHARRAELARHDAEAMVGFLTNVFSRPDPARDGHSVTVAEILNHAVIRLDADLVEQPRRRDLLHATLAETYRALGLYREAIPLLEKVRDYARASAGRTHPRTLAAMIRLAESYGYAGRHGEAVRLKEEVLDHQRQTLGAHNPETLVAMDQLAVSYEEVGRLEEALNLNRESVELHRKVNGPAHRHTVTATRRLACSLARAGQGDEAYQILHALLPLSRESLGSEDRETLWIMAELGVLHTARSEHDQAMSYRQQVVDLSRKTLGPEHPDTLHAMFRLADSLKETGQAVAALKLRETVVESGRRILGSDHQYTLQAMTAFATSLQAVPGRFDEAIRLMEEVLEIRLRVNGSDHRSTLLIMHLLASYYHDAGRLDDAVRLGSEVVTARRRVLGDDNPETLWSLANLGEYLERTQRLEEALQAREEVVTRRRTLLGPAHPDTVLAMERWVRSSRLCGRDMDADRHSAEVDSRREQE